MKKYITSTAFMNRNKRNKEILLPTKKIQIYEEEKKTYVVATNSSVNQVKQTYKGRIYNVSHMKTFHECQ